MSKTLKAAPGRVVVAFPPPQEKMGEIYVPETSKRRPELGTIVDIGDPLDEKQSIQAKWLREQAKNGHVFPVSFGAGVGYWQREFGDDFECLKHVRVFRIEELATSMPVEKGGAA